MDRFLDAIILFCLVKLNGERSISAVYHLFTGKKTSQTIQDSHLFGLDRFFGTFPSLSREELAAVVDKYERAGYIKNLSNHKYALTGEGMTVCHNYLQESPIPHHLNGWKHQSKAELVWKRLSLLIQTLSYIVRHEKRFYPIQKDYKVQAWVKGFIASHQLSRDELAEAVLLEMTSLLDHSDSRSNDIFVMRLSSHGKTGLTFRQISEQTGLEESRAYYLFLEVLHLLAGSLQAGREAYPVLNRLIDGPAGRSAQITQSTLATYQYLLQGMDKKSIGQVRRLKESTIEDHIVELALMIPDFDLSPYIPESLTNEIIQTAAKGSSRKLREIKESLTGRASYFQIRLVLARFGGTL
ncbi:helix-turn-helix domain-containing protein [Peribacillus sp. SCS-37]|uniref:helix-turn-helix domain-containing protein n=1 Tax=Paraperibacillus esterisolvens TaxID=3115296 RepID=UPI003905AF25